MIQPVDDAPEGPLEVRVQIDGTAKQRERPSYKTFSFVGGMPKLNLRNKEAADFAIDVASYWIKECDIDGWRLDVADEIHHGFWKRFRREIKAVTSRMTYIPRLWAFWTSSRRSSLVPKEGSMA